MHALQELVRRFDTLKGLTGTPHVDERFAMLAHSAIAAARVPIRTELELTPQLELLAGLAQPGSWAGPIDHNEVPGLAPQSSMEVA